MFDIGFPELLLVSVVALLVIGPDKLPETVRTIALWIGRIKRGLSDIKADIEKEIGADEIRRQLHNESIMKELDNTKNEISGIMKDAEVKLAAAKQSASMNPDSSQPDAGITAPATNNSSTEPEHNDGSKSEPGG